MPIETLSCGVPYNLTQNVIYALPSLKVMGFVTSLIFPVTLEMANSSDFIMPVEIEFLTGKQTFEISGKFIRCTSSDVRMTVCRA